MCVCVCLCVFVCLRVCVPFVTLDVERDGLKYSPRRVCSSGLEYSPLCAMLGRTTNFVLRLET